MATQSNSRFFYISISCLLFLIIYIVFVLTLGTFDIKKQYALSLLFLNMWEHLSQFSLAIDKDLINLEGFDINGKVTTYFLPFPSFIRALLSLFSLGESAILSILLGMLLFFLATLFLWRFIYENRLETKKSDGSTGLIFGIFFATLLSPMMSMISFPTVFWEAIVWASSLFFLACFFSVKSLYYWSTNKKIFLFFSIICCLCLFTRANFSFTVCFLYALTLLGIIYSERQNHSPWLDIATNKILIISTTLFTSGLILLLFFNYAKWGSPFEFYPLQHYKMWSAEQKIKYLSHAGALDLTRLPITFQYYFIPSFDNFSFQYPFIKMANSGALVQNKSFDYHEPRLALLLTQPITIILFVIGVFSFLVTTVRSKFKTYFYLLPVAICSLIPIFFILSIHSLSIRYTGDFIPALTFFSLLGIVFLVKTYRQIKIFQAPKVRLFSQAFTFILIGTFIAGGLLLSTSGALLQNALWNTSFHQFELIPVKNNETVEFKLRGNNDKGTGYLRTGWSDQLELFGTWSDAKKTSLLVMPSKPLNANSYLTLSANAFIPPNHSSQKITIWVNGKYNQTIALSQSETNQITIRNIAPNENSSKLFTISARLFQKMAKPFGDFELAPIWIQFLINAPGRPKDYGINSDDRLLGLGLISLTLHE